MALFFLAQLTTGRQYCTKALASHENTNAVVWNQEFAGLVVLEDLLVLEGLGRQGARLSGAGVTRTG
ncbi:MAG TPA: hypothetical protein VIY49_26975, partial [Bryobacteraceae bacterium]